MAKKNIIIIAGIVLALGLIGGIAAWALSSHEDSPFSSSARQKSQFNADVQSACKKSGGDDQLCRFYASAHDFSNAPAQMTVTTSEGTTKVIYDGKGNMRTESGDGMQYVLVDGESYVLDAGAKEWVKVSSMGDEGQPRTLDLGALQEQFKSDEHADDGAKLHYVRLGEKQLHGKTVVGYKVYKDEDRDEASELWFSTADYKLYQIRTTEDEDDSDDDDDDTMVVDLSYDPVTISVPSPVRELELK